MPLSTRLIALVDDTPAWHEVTAATIARHPAWRYEGFHSGHAALMAWSHRSSEDLPAVVLMDFFLGDSRGDEITRQLRLQLAGWPLVIGHSSVTSGSRAIVQAGGDLVLRKHADGSGINPSLDTWLAGEVEP